MRDFHHLVLAPLAFALGAGACAGTSTATSTSGAAPSLSAGSEAAALAPNQAGARGVNQPNLAGARCQGAVCTCRSRAADPAEKVPPDEAHKRFEIRMGATGGGATLDSPTLGHFTAGADEACFYIDVLPGTTSDITFTATEAVKEGGIGPLLQIAEYGPKGPWWYDVIGVHCPGPNGRCNRDAADAWSAEAKGRKRGRADACGSSVISHLTWDTSGGVGNRELGLFKDFTVHFTMEVKRFPTQWPPHSKECVAGR
jgi:hypothetical protein